MLKSNTLIILILSTVNLYAEADLKIGTSGRTYPRLSGGAYLSAGYNQSIFGEISKSNPLYSMFRVEGEYNTSSVVDSSEAGVYLYPISFLAFGVGQKIMNSRYEDFTYYDCEEHRCTGKLTKNFTKAKIGLNFGSLLLSFNYKFSLNKYSDKDELRNPVAEYEDLLLVNTLKEKNLRRTYFLGWSAGDYTLGVLGINSSYYYSEVSFHSHYLLINKKVGNIDIMAGAGNLYSSLIKPGPTFIFKIDYHFKRSQSLF